MLHQVTDSKIFRNELPHPFTEILSFLIRLSDDRRYTGKNFDPMIDHLQEELKEEVPVRAGLLNENPREAMTTFERNLASLKEHLAKRREFLLAQDEIKDAGKFDRAALK